MAGTDATLSHMRFLLLDAIRAPKALALDGLEPVTDDLVSAILEEAGRFAEGELKPLNKIGDRQGCVLENGVVRTPDGFKEAYAQLIEGGWTGLSAAETYGGQGLPHTLMVAVQELQASANLSFSIYPGLSHGAYEALNLHGTDAQKALYLPRLAAGDWSGTMCLTEPQCGTDLGLIRTKAAVDPDDDGAYAISGTKIFISAGEHDLTDNIVHLVLARLPDAPEGIRGISLFVVPKFLPNEDGSVGPRNGITCVRLEEKMGIHGSATCQMALDGAKGWLVGQPHKGMRAMFTMMNAARLGVALQGVAVAQAAYDVADAYARDRRQGRALSGAAEPMEAADPLIVHPDIRRMLLSIRSFIEGARGLAYKAAAKIDLSRHHPDPEVRAEADDFVALLTPVMKAFFTDEGFAATVTAQQILGGHGYTQEWPVEQFVRDARIAQIYEGANGIQGLDLVGRKLPKDMGRLLRRFFHPADALLTAHADDPDFGPLVRPLRAAFGQLQDTSLLVAARGLADPEEAAAAATDYLAQFGLVAVGVEWLEQCIAAREAVAAERQPPEWLESRSALARFWMTRVLPRGAGHALAIKAGKSPLMVDP